MRIHPGISGVPMSDARPVARLSVWHAFIEGVKLAWEHRLDVFKLAAMPFAAVLLLAQLALGASVAIDADRAVATDRVVDGLTILAGLVFYAIVDINLFRLALGAKPASPFDMDWRILSRLLIAYLKVVGLFFLGMIGFVFAGLVAGAIYSYGFDKNTIEQASNALIWALIWIWITALIVRLTFYFPDIIMDRNVKLRAAWRETWNLPIGFCIGAFVFYTLTIGIPLAVSDPLTDVGYQSRLWLFGKGLMEAVVYVVSIFTVSVLYRQWRLKRPL